MDPIIVEEDNNSQALNDGSNKINGNTEDDHNSDSQVTVDLDNSNGNANLNQAAATNSTTNKPVGNYKAQLLSSISASYLCISAGTVLGYTSTAIPSMQKQQQFELSEYDISWIGSLISLGAMTSSFLSIFIIRTFGTRKAILFFALPLFLLSWMAIASFHLLGMIFLGRFVGGLACGIIISTSPVYVTDIVSINRRGSLGVIPNLFLSVGILLVYVLGKYLDWQYLAIACGFISMPALILLLLFTPDTPSWLVLNGRIARAKLVLLKFRSLEESELILARLQNDQQARNISYLQDPPKGVCSYITDRGFLISAVLSALPQLIGINFVTFYGVKVFSTLGPAIDPNIPCIIFATTQVFATLFTISLIERYGRKILLTISSITVGLCSITLGIYFSIGQFSSTSSSFLIWIPSIVISLYVVCFCVGLGPITWILVVELLSKTTKHVQNPILIGFMWFISFLVTYLCPILEVKAGLQFVFGLFGLIGIIGAGFIILAVPETQGKTNEQIRAIFGDTVKQRSDNCGRDSMENATIVETGNAICAAETEEEQNKNEHEYQTKL